MKTQREVNTQKVKGLVKKRHDIFFTKSYFFSLLGNAIFLKRGKNCSKMHKTENCGVFDFGYKF